MGNVSLRRARRQPGDLLAEPTPRHLSLFTESDLDEVRRWPDAAMQPDRPLVTFTAKIRPIMAARIEAIVRRAPLYAVGGPEGAIISRGVMMLEGELRMPAALDRLAATHGTIQNLDHWAAIRDRKRAEARTAKRKARGVCPTCGAEPRKGGAHA